MTTPKSKKFFTSVFKHKRSSSLLDVNNDDKLIKLPRKSISANVTPERSKQNSVSSLINKFKGAHKESKRDSTSSKELHKALKHLKKEKSLQNGGLENGIGILGPTNVHLKSVKKNRPSLNVNKSRQTLTPAKVTTPLNKVKGSKSKSPPQAAQHKPPTNSKANNMIDKLINKTNLRRKSSNLSASKTTTPVPSKRRKLSGNSAANKDNESDRDSVIMTPPHGDEVRIPLPAHPSTQMIGPTKMYNSTLESKKLFECIIHPIKIDKFFSELWEKKPLLVKRHIPSYNDGWFSTNEFDKILREQVVEFTRNLDVVGYVNGKRETYNPPGRAYPSIVWDYYQNGCSIRLLNPQTYSKNIWKLLSVLQEYFGCMTGANIYLTPPNSQGFAPHWDDIEAFILQLEGKKRWRLYNPRTPNETLPRISSKNLDENDIGEPILDVILEAGDLLYFPRGTIHQGNTIDDQHSLHITVSTMQKNTWGDFLQKLLPQALELAMEEDIDFRLSLPIDYLNYMGIANSDQNDPRRTTFLRRLECLLTKLLSHVPVDATADQMGKQFCLDTLPPVFTEEERMKSIHSHQDRWSHELDQPRNVNEYDETSYIKLIRKGVLRLVMESDVNTVTIYHNLENTRIWHEIDSRGFDIKSDYAPAVEYLLHSYPEFQPISSLPLDSIEEKMELVSIFYDKGLLMTQLERSTLSEEINE